MLLRFSILFVFVFVFVYLVFLSKYVSTDTLISITSVERIRSTTLYSSEFSDVLGSA